MSGLRLGPTERLWLAGGAAGAVLLALAAWFLFISPQHAQAATLRSQTVTQQAQVASLRHRLNELRDQNSRIDAYRATLAHDVAALPQQAGLADFLRELQAAAGTAAVTVKAIGVGVPTAVVNDSRAYSLQISLTIDGQLANLGSFLDQVQRLAPRAVLVNNINTSDNLTGAPGGQTMTVSLQVFVAQVNGD